MALMVKSRRRRSSSSDLAVGHLRIAAGAVVRLAAIGGDLEADIAAQEPDRSEGDSHLPDALRPATNDFEDLLRARIRSEVQIRRVAGRNPEQRIADRTADEIQLMAGRREKDAQLVGRCRHSQQVADGTRGRVVGVVEIKAGHE